MQFDARHRFLLGFESGKEGSGMIGYGRNGKIDAGRWMGGPTAGRGCPVSVEMKKSSPVHRVHATPVMNARSLVGIGSDAEMSSVHIANSFNWNSGINHSSLGQSTVSDESTCVSMNVTLIYASN